MSDISRFSAISSRLLLVAFSICSSKALLAEDENQPLIMLGGMSRERTEKRADGRFAGDVARYRDVAYASGDVADGREL